MKTLLGIAILAWGLFTGYCVWIDDPNLAMRGIAGLLAFGATVGGIAFLVSER